MSSRDSELLNAIKTLNSTITTLNTSVNALSSKYVTALDTADVVTGYATKFGMIDIGMSASVPATTSGPIAYDENGTFYSVDGTTVVKWSLNDAANVIVVAALPGGASGLAICYDTTNDYIIVGEEPSALWGGGVSGLVWTYNTGGTLLYTATILNPVMAPTEEAPVALAYDADNDQVYIVYWGEFRDVGAGIGARFGKLNIQTGVITDYFDIPYTFAENLAMDAGFFSGVLFVSYNQGALQGITGFEPSTGTPKFTGSVPATDYVYFDIDDTTNIFYFWDNATLFFKIAGLSHIQRMSIFDDGGITVSVDDGGGLISIDDGAGSITVDGSVTASITLAPSIADSNVLATAAATELVATRAARRGLIIQNADTTNTVWIGDAGVTTGTGLELLPKQTMQLNHYTGATASIYGICSALLTADIRIIEVF